MLLDRTHKPRHAKPSRRKATTVATGTAMVLALDLAGASSASAHDRSFNTMLDQLAGCESGGNYSINTGNGYYGAFQFNLQTWRSVGGAGYPHQNPPNVQKEMATRLYESRGWGPWPSCSRKLGLHATTVERPWAGNAPQGNVDALSTRQGAISLRGWAFDRDVAGSIDVHVYVDGRGTALRADRARPDVQNAMGHGANSGWHLALPASAGSHHVCVYAIGAGGGAANTSLGCRDVTVPPAERAPIGHLDEVTPVDGGLRVRGWTLDLDQPAVSTDAHFYVDGQGAAATQAAESRPDVARAYGVPEVRGYDVVVPAGTEVCSYAIDTTGRAANSLLGCKAPGA